MFFTKLNTDNIWLDDGNQRRPPYSAAQKGENLAPTLCCSFLPGCAYIRLIWICVFCYNSSMFLLDFFVYLPNYFIVIVNTQVNINRQYHIFFRHYIFLLFILQSILQILSSSGRAHVFQAACSLSKQTCVPLMQPASLRAAFYLHWTSPFTISISIHVSDV